MNTAFNTGPGFYAANTRQSDDTVPEGQIRFLIARIEAYDGPLALGTDLDKTQFKLLAAMADGNPALARALLALHQALGANLKLLRAEARQRHP